MHTNLTYKVTMKIMNKIFANRIQLYSKRYNITTKWVLFQKWEDGPDKSINTATVVTGLKQKFLWSFLER